jgi:DNA-binding NarL/FixJ family response regulator
MLAARAVRPGTYTQSTPRSRRGSAIDEITQLAESSIAARSRGDMEATSKHTIAAMRIARGSEIGVLPGNLLLPTLFFQLGMSAEMTEHETLALEAFQRAYGGAVATGDVRTAANASAESALIHTFAGRRRLADTWIERHFAVTSTFPGIRGLRSTVHLVLASRLHDELRFDEARAELALAHSDSISEHWPELVSHRILFDAFSGDYSMWELLSAVDAEAIEYAAHSPGEGFGQQMFDYARAVALGFGGQPERALPILERSIEGSGSGLARPRRAATEYALGDFVAASRDVSIILATLSTRPRSIIEGLVIGAAIAWRRGDAAAAAENYHQAVRMATEHRLLISLAIVPLDDTVELARVAFGDDIPEALRRVIDQPQVFVPPIVMLEKLTAQEQRVLSELAHGETLHRVAETLHLSANTVKVHTRAIYRKLGVSTRSEMMAEATRRGLV